MVLTVLLAPAALAALLFVMSRSERHLDQRAGTERTVTERTVTDLAGTPVHPTAQLLQDQLVIVPL
jgi:hypothetical protein